MLSIRKLELTISTIVLPLLVAIWPAALHAQSCCPDLRFELLQTHMMGIEFQQRQLEYRAWRDQSGATCRTSFLDLRTLSWL
jgi:hypothetical protein